MSSTINASTASGGGVITTADASGILQLQTAGVTGLTIDASQNVTFAKSILTSATAQASTSGTSIDFTGIPSWDKRITVMFNGVSTNGTSLIQIQLGSTSVVTSGYTGYYFMTNTIRGALSSGFIVNGVGAITSTNYGTAGITLLSGNTWGSNMTMVDSGVSSATPTQCAGSLALSGALDRVRITTVNGTDTFDAGSINIMYE